MNRRQFIAGLAGATVTERAVVGTAAAQGGKTHTVQMVTSGGSYYFDPVGLYVDPGDTVKWVIKSGGHSTTSYSPGNPEDGGVNLIPKGAKGWDSGVLQNPGQSFSYTFEAQGTYDYYCIPHKSLGMIARIVCGKPGGPAEGNSPPDNVGEGDIPDSQTIVQAKSLSYPYIAKANTAPLPPLFWEALALFGLANIYLFSRYDRESGQYDEYEVED